MRMKVSISQPHTKGFSLVEMLVYVAMLVVVATVSVASLISLSDSFQQQKARQLVVRNAVSVTERMLTDIRVAQDVDQFSSTFQATPGVLTLVNGPTTTAYSVVSGVLEVSVENESSALTDNAVTIDEIIFYLYDNTVTEFVRMQLTLSATAGSVTYTETFNAGAVLRGSYE